MWTVSLTSLWWMEGGWRVGELFVHWLIWSGWRQEVTDWQKKPNKYTQVTKTDTYSTWQWIKVPTAASAVLTDDVKISQICFHKRPDPKTNTQHTTSTKLPAHTENNPADRRAMQAAEWINLGDARQKWSSRTESRSRHSESVCSLLHHEMEDDDTEEKDADIPASKDINIQYVCMNTMTGLLWITGLRVGFGFFCFFFKDHFCTISPIWDFLSSNRTKHKQN